jgi:hypothetical protein
MMKAQQHQIFNEIECNDLYGMKRTIAATPSALSMRRMPVRHTGFLDLAQCEVAYVDCDRLAGGCACKGIDVGIVQGPICAVGQPTSAQSHMHQIRHAV